MAANRQLNIRHLLYSLALALVAWLLPLYAVAQGPDSWPLERLHLKNGNVVEGMIIEDEGEMIEVVELRRPPGKPMFLVARPIARFDVARVERLNDGQRKVLDRKIQRFRNRTLVEQGHIESVKLAPIEFSGAEAWRYQGHYFRLDSDLDERTTRLCIVRLEQMFVAYRQVLPIRHMPRIDNLIKIRVYGSTSSYYDALNTLGIEIRNLAYYDPSANLVVAGCDVSEFGRELEKSRQEHEKILRQYDQWNKSLTKRLKGLETSLEQNDVPRAERSRILSAARSRWEQDVLELRDRVRLIERKNDALMDGLVDEMLRSLYHEAFHAYLEDYVFRRSLADVPNWLNEGLAQIFEAGLLDAGTLRIDAPVAKKLTRLKTELKGSNTLSLADLLATDGQAFLVHRSGPADAAQRRYLYAWGLAYYLTFDRGLLATPRFESYVLKGTVPGDQSPIARFEKLVGQDIGEFERQWHDYIAKLR